jgi:hypothetical protein
MVGGLPFYWFPDRGIPRGPESRDIGPLSAAAAAAAAAAASHRIAPMLPSLLPPAREGGTIECTCNRKRAANYCPNRVPLPSAFSAADLASVMPGRERRDRCARFKRLDDPPAPPPPPVAFRRFAGKRAAAFDKNSERRDVTSRFIT